YPHAVTAGNERKTGNVAHKHLRTSPFTFGAVWFEPGVRRENALSGNIIESEPDIDGGRRPRQVEVDMDPQFPAYPHAFQNRPAIVGIEFNALQKPATERPPVRRFAQVENVPVGIQFRGLAVEVITDRILE